MVKIGNKEDLDGRWFEYLETVDKPIVLKDAKDVIFRSTTKFDRPLLTQEDVSVGKFRCSLTYMHDFDFGHASVGVSGSLVRELCDGDLLVVLLSETFGIGIDPAEGFVVHVKGNFRKVTKILRRIDDMKICDTQSHKSARSLKKV